MWTKRPDIGPGCDAARGLGLTLARGLAELHGGRLDAFSDGPGRGSEFVLSPDSREMLSRMLALDGYSVRAAVDGQAGLELIAAEPPDVALVDLGLPGLDGYELARRVRAKLGNDRVRLVALTGYGRESDRQAVHDAGFDAHLVKPVSVEDLYRVLHDPR
ncbi:MAG TPA: response regulator [Planctomycetaceae bacterium]|nr:response regulator [Planctomycetaceae bacterium]